MSEFQLTDWIYLKKLLQSEEQRLYNLKFYNLIYRHVIHNL